jgi:hypothetical protein
MKKKIFTGIGIVVILFAGLGRYTASFLLPKRVPIKLQSLVANGLGH